MVGSDGIFSLRKQNELKVNYLGSSERARTVDFGVTQICVIRPDRDDMISRASVLACEAAFSGVTCGRICVNKDNDADMMKALTRHPVGTPPLQ